MALVADGTSVPERPTSQESQVTRAGLEDSYSLPRLVWLIVGLFALILLRKPDFLTTPQLFGEDGVIFFRENILFGLKAVTHTYNGYMHLIPRLVAATSNLLPIVYAPVIYGLVGVAFQAVAAAFFFHRSNRFLLRSDLLRAVVAVIICVSFQPDELLGNAVNIQWHLYALTLVLLAHVCHFGERFDNRKALGYALVLFALGLNNPLLIVMAPLAVWRMLVADRLRERLTMAAFCAAIAFQGVCYLKTAPDAGPGSRLLAGESRPAFAVRLTYATASSFVFRAVLSPTLSQKGAAGAARLSTLGAFFGTLGLLGALAVSLRRRLDHAERVRVLVALASVLLSIALPLLLRGLTAYFPTLHEFHLFDAPRYFLLGASVFTWIMALGAERLLPHLSERNRALALTLVFLAGTVGNFRDRPYPDSGWRSRSADVERWVAEYRTGVRPAKLVVPQPPGSWFFVLE